MSLLRELSRQVLIGSDRRPPQLPAHGGEIGTLLAHIAGGEADIETRVLQAAGALALLESSGGQPAQTTETPLPPSPPESRPMPRDPQFLSVLQAIFDDGPDILRVEALRLLADAGHSLPPRLLPRLLDSGKDNKALRPAIQATLGERGRWLAEQNPDWSYVASGAVSASHVHWEHGSQDDRAAYLGALRAAQPEAARALLQQEFAGMDARERTRLLGLCVVGLAPADEDFLEAQLRDRSKEVRQCAADLLARLPASRYVARMSERLAACLKQERKLLRQVWVLEPPEKFDPAWKDDAVDESRPKSESLGERAWWLHQIATALPLSWWTRQLDMSPRDLIKWGWSGDWKEALQRAWREAWLRAPDAQWAEAWLDVYDNSIALPVLDLIEVLPEAARERYWLAMLKLGVEKRAISDIAAHAIKVSAPERPAFSAPFGRALLDNVRAQLGKQQLRWDNDLRRLLPDFVSAMPEECLSGVAQGWQVDTPGTDYFAATVARITAIADLRLALRRHLSNSNPKR